MKVTLYSVSSEVRLFSQLHSYAGKNIREYLRIQFKGFALTEKPDAPSSHTFTVTKSADEQYHLKVYWSQLSDQSQTPERTQQCLVVDDVAGRMKGKSQVESSCGESTETALKEG